MITIIVIMVMMIAAGFVSISPQVNDTLNNVVALVSLLHSDSDALLGRRLAICGFLPAESEWQIL